MCLGVCKSVLNVLHGVIKYVVTCFLCFLIFFFCKKDYRVAALPHHTWRIIHKTDDRAYYPQNRDLEYSSPQLYTEIKIAMERGDISNAISKIVKERESLISLCICVCVCVCVCVRL